MLLEQLYQESTGTSDIADGVPEIVKISNRILDYSASNFLTDMQKTSYPLATVYGLKTGEVGKSHRTISGLEVEQTPPADGMVSGDTFVLDGYQYRVIIDGDYAANDTQSLNDKVISGHLMLVTEGGLGEDFEPNHADIELDRWSIDVKSRKIRVSNSLEFEQSLKSLGLNSDDVTEFTFIRVLSDEIQSDIINKLITISSKEAGTIELSSSKYEQGRELISAIYEQAAKIQSDSSHPATAVVVSSSIANVIQSSGQLINGQLHGAANTAPLTVVVDAKSVSSYFMVVSSTKHASALYWSPMINRKGGIFSVALSRDVKNLQPNYYALLRYGLSVNPHETTEDGPHDGDDWLAHANKSKLARICRVQIATT
ncbi:hypothetical protein [Vibrio coralliirubri]|uniref:hypothetical protein n=1 Tax=Vibrio coralliirubri TaxID=1516159 RepID=UPI0006331F9E|nr:hypothetical protein [Vibrio coralliirubri]CDT47884.1 putative Head vertex protein [Vibrio coralliirubri]